MSTTSPYITANFAAAYNDGEAESGKFAIANTSDELFDDYPSEGRGKYVMLTYNVSDQEMIELDKAYVPAEAERGKFVKLNMSTETGYPSAGGRGRYAVLTYSVNGPHYTTAVPSSSIDDVTFQYPHIYGTPTDPLSGDIQADYTNAQFATVQKIYHFSSVAPTFPAEWVILGDAVYIPDELNIIYAEFVNNSRIEYWLVQEQ